MALGAFGAHVLKSTLSRKPGAIENWRTAVSYQLLHAVALLSLSSLTAEKSRTLKNITPSFFKGGNLLAAGTLMFSGSIYLLCLDVGPKSILGPVTPVGGFLLIGGWLMIGMGNL